MKHAKEEHYIAEVPSDSYYRAQIRTLQDKLEKFQYEVSMKDEYIKSLEASNRALNVKVETLRNAALGLIEDKYHV